jgi:hypothetical protein
MALILKDRVKETTAVTSTGTATLLGASVGYQSFSVIGNGNTCYYTIAAQTTNEWEVGIGTYTSPNQLSRDTVLSSSNSNALVNFSAGTKDVFVAQPAEKAVYTDASDIINTSGNGANTVAFTNINASNVVMVSGTISTNAANATDITNKTYVDNLFSTGITYHAPVLVESPTALIATYNQPGGAGNGVGATLTNSGANVALSIDGVSLSNTARVLVYTQSNAVQNGVYTVTNPGNVSAQWVLTRATDADTYGVGDPNKLGQGDAFFVQSGNTGAGETYILNTVGTITFGTTNLTFAQISSAQVYSAGTGLNLANLTFSIANTAVTAATYGNAGQVPQIAVNAQGQITSASNVSINASSITLGTLDNARTTAASANGASTIVARDANGNFTANVITATTSNATTFNGTTGSFTNVSGNGVALTAINASNITSGTIANARTTASDANSASTIVARDANGSFGANIITATFSGNGATLSAINASNISSGTIANARTTASSSNGASTIVQRDSGGNFSANTVTAAVIGDLSGGSNINASNIASGTIANARTTASSSNGASTIVLRGASGEFAAGAITGASFSGNGSAITAINATAITTGTIDNARTTAASANGASTIVARDAGGNFSANTITATTFSGAMSGNGAALTNINASNISSGTIANARTTAATANGASTIVLRGASGEFSAGAITGASFTGDGAAISNTNASNLSAGTVANARTTGASANGASTLVLRDANGSFAGNVGTFNGVTVGTTNSSFDTDVLFVDAINNRVGIGTTSPVGRVSVTTSGNATSSGAPTAWDSTYAVIGTGAGSTTGIALGFGTTATTGYILSLSPNLFWRDLVYNAATHIFKASDIERMRLDNTGNLGLGVTPSAWGTSFSQKALQVGSVAAFSSLDAGTNNRQVTLANNAYFDNTNQRYIVSDFANMYRQVNGQHQWYYAPSGTAGNTITFTQAMTLDASGNLGVGTSTITGAANTNLQVKNSAAAAVRVTGGSGTGFDVLQASDSVAYLYNRDNTATVFGTNNTERMRITSTGDLLVGTTSATSKLTSSAGAADGATGYAGAFHANKGATGDAWIQLGGARSDGLGASRVSFINAAGAGGTGKLAFQIEGTERMRIDSSGNVGIGTASPTTSRVQIKGANNTTNAFSDGLKVTSNNETVSCQYSWTGINANSVMLFGIADTERMRINSSGNVSVGTTTGNARFTVQGDSTIQLFNAAGSNQSDIYFADAQTLAIASYNASGSAIRFNTNPNAGSATERMRIDSVGNVGIGTSSPSTPLASVRGMVINGAALTDVQFRLQNNNTGSTSGDGVLLSLASDSSAYLWNYENQAFIFGTNNTERMRVTNAGNLLIGTTTAVSTLTVNGDIDANFFINSNQISANYTVPANFNAMTTGPITINTGITVTVSTGSVWTVI